MEDCSAATSAAARAAARAAALASASASASASAPPFHAASSGSRSAGLHRIANEACTAEIISRSFSFLPAPSLNGGAKIRKLRPFQIDQSISVRTTGAEAHTPT